MKETLLRFYPVIVLGVIPYLVVLLALSPACAGQDELDRRVKSFLDDHAWHDMNVPEGDGQMLHDLILRHHYTRALEIGTSTGHSGIWMAWALKKTGGRLITIDIDEHRQSQALENFQAVGLADVIDARLGDAHQIVPALEGPFDFVFSDADKGWYKNYFDAVFPKLEVGGCFTTHNIIPNGWNDEYLKYLQSLPHLDTTVDTRGGGLAISFKRSP